MSIQSTKALLWLGSVGLFGGLGYTVYDHLETQDVKGKPLAAADYEPFLKEVEEPAPPTDDLVDYDSVLATFHNMDWTGKEVIVHVLVDPTTVKPIKAPVIPAADLVDILMTTVDSSHPEDSSAFIKLKKSTMVGNSPEGDKILLLTGDTLPKPHDDIKIETIEPGWIVFSFGEEYREHERLQVLTPDDGSLIVVVGEGDVPIEPPSDAREIRVKPGVFNAERTYMRRSGDRNSEWVVGSKDREIWAKSYSEILANDVSYRRYRDPRTGKITGVEITNVKPGSMAASHGVESGMVVKSINGHAVTSTSDAIAYAKQNADTTSDWVIVYMKQGKEYTTTYHSD